MAYKNPEDKTRYQREYMRKIRAKKKDEKPESESTIVSLALESILYGMVGSSIADFREKHPDVTDEEIERLIIQMFTAIMQGIKKSKEEAIRKNFNQVFGFIAEIPIAISRIFDVNLFKSGGSRCQF